MRKSSIKHNMPIYWDVRWRGTQTFFNNTLAGKELIRECFLLYEKNIDCTSEQILTSAVRKVREKNIATLPSEFMVSKTFLWNENNIAVAEPLIFELSEDSPDIDIIPTGATVQRNDFLSKGVGIFGGLLGISLLLTGLKSSNSRGK